MRRQSQHPPTMPIARVPTMTTKIPSTSTSTSTNIEDRNQNFVRKWRSVQRNSSTQAQDGGAIVSPTNRQYAQPHPSRPHSHYRRFHLLCQQHPPPPPPGNQPVSTAAQFTVDPLNTTTNNLITSTHTSGLHSSLWWKRLSGVKSTASAGSPT